MNFKEYCEGMFDFVFSTLMEYKKEEEENIIFNIPVKFISNI